MKVYWNQLQHLHSTLLTVQIVDGNKRIGTYVMLVLLELNNINVDFTDDDIVRIGLGIANDTMSDSELLNLILENSN